VEHFSLETKTYFLHDICHYCVEKNMKLSKGFWGMLAEGYSFTELVGKTNPQTGELRCIEKIVGPIQAVVMGNIQKENLAIFIQHLDFTVQEPVLNAILSETESIMQSWKQLPVGGQLLLEWKT